MRRILATVLVLAVAAVAVAAGGSGEARTYRVDAVFDNASSLIPGNVVKIAGAPVGEVKDIRLTRDRKARVEMEIEEGYAPFRSDAQCVIAPESLFIGEKFLQCKPGTPKGRPLAAATAARLRCRSRATPRPSTSTSCSRRCGCPCASG